MKKRIALFMCILLLAACAPQTQPPASQEAAVSVLEQSSSIAEPEEDPPHTSSVASPSQTQEPGNASASDVQTPDVPSPSQDEAESVPIQVRATLKVSYGGGAPHFSQTLAVPSDASFTGDADTVTVERQTENGWETIRDGDTGDFMLEGKITVNGPLPARILEDAAEGTPYRLTTMLYMSTGQTVSAACTFRAGETFAEGAPENELINADSFQLVTTVDASGEGLLPFSQVVVNNGGQTVRLERGYQVLRQTSGGSWKASDYPDGQTPPEEGETVLLLPGQSAQDMGLLPVTMAQAKRGGRYRIVRTAHVVSPREGQESTIEFFTELEAGAAFREAAVKPAVDAPADVAISLGQLSFSAGEVPITCYLQNKSQEPIVAGKFRVYNVKDGDNLLPEDVQASRMELPVGDSQLVLDTALTLAPGEYAAEVSVWDKEGGGEAPLSKNFTVVSGKPADPASASTVGMKVSVEGQTEEGLAAFTQTFTNNSSQTLLAGRAFRVEQMAGGLWTRAEYPAGSEPVFPEDLVLVRPGESVTFDGVLPFMERDMPEMYRITRTLMVDNPLPGQTNGLTLVYTVTKK